MDGPESFGFLGVRFYLFVRSHLLPIVIVLALHGIYAAVWLWMSGETQWKAELWITAVAESIALVFYVVLVIAFWKAKKTRINAALAIQKFYWALLIGLFALPTQIGVIQQDVPYRANPYTLIDTPGWLRTYVWIGIAVTITGVLYEFWAINWGPKTASPWPVRERRSGTDRRAGWGKQ